MFEETTRSNILEKHGEAFLCERGDDVMLINDRGGTWKGATLYSD